MAESAAEIVAEIMQELGYDPGYEYMDNYAHTGFFAYSGPFTERHGFAVFRKHGLFGFKEHMGDVSVGYGEIPEVSASFADDEHAQAVESLAAAIAARLGRDVPVERGR